ncbi:hypothetical protein ACGG0V_004563 [Salmonella enterica]|uniref:hypothetical protein n=1 Tax=Serratia sp. OPWLW2 TaxID=1928658 RepID=UPI000C589989|nr:hypothetical protein [Serratia sp. OPWLW2]EJX5188425.1 hypothetical protein [Salmonella enterica]EKT1605363.1 hypothetical protein [Salmonella enterica]PIJ42816.1 hypothetical protein BOM25_13470 [Serratia sp. OPWLW2]
MVKKKISAIFVLIFSIITLVGCNDKGHEFIGKWEQLTEEKYPSEIVISYTDSVFHVDVNAFDPDVAQEKYLKVFNDYMLGKSKERPDRSKMDERDSYRKTAYEAKAISDEVLQGDGFSLRLENGRLKYKNEVYVKR